MITICEPLKPHVVRNGYCVNCGGKGGTPGPCKTSFDDPLAGQEIGEDPKAPTVPTVLPGSAGASVAGPEKYLSEGDVKNLKRIVKETAKGIKLPDTKNMTPEQIQGEMDKLYIPLALGDVRSFAIGQSLQMQADHYRDGGFAARYPWAYQQVVDSANSKLAESGFSPIGGQFGDAMKTEYGVDDKMSGLMKVVESNDGRTFKAYQSPLVSAYRNEVMASAPMKKLQAAKVKAEQKAAKKRPAKDQYGNKVKPKAK